MGFEPLKRILRQTVAANPISKDLQIARIFHEWEESLAGFWGEEKAAYVAAVSFREGVLTVEISSPSAMQQIATDMVRLQNDTNRRLGSLLVRSVRLRRRGF